MSPWLVPRHTGQQRLLTGNWSKLLEDEPTFYGKVVRHGSLFPVVPLAEADHIQDLLRV